MRHPPHHLVIFMESASQHYDNLIEKENIAYNFSKADYEKERHFELALYCNDISPVSGVKSSRIIKLF